MKTSKKILEVGFLFVLFIILIQNAYADVQCDVWQPPSDGRGWNKASQTCEQCGLIAGQEGFADCNEYWCHSLGVDCAFDAQDQKCFNAAKDKSAPEFVKCEVADIISGNMYQTRNDGSSCVVQEDVPNNQVSLFHFELDEPGACLLSYNPNNLDPQNPENAILLETRNNLPGRDQFLWYADPNGDLSQYCSGGKCIFYIKCGDFVQNWMNTPYKLEFSVYEGPDIAPPKIIGAKYSDGANIAMSVESIQNFFILVYDASGVEECKYSDDNSLTYNQGEKMDCKYQQEPIPGYYCYKNSLPVDVGENKYYFMCKDVKGNIMPNWEEYKLDRVEANFEIGITSPGEGSALQGTNNQLKIGVTGDEGGIAYCKFGVKWEGDSGVLTTSIDMNKESDKVYAHSLDLVNEGQYKIRVDCLDNSGQLGSDEASFVYKNNPLKFSFNPGSGTSVSENSADVELTVSGGRNNDGSYDICKFKKLQQGENINLITFAQLDRNAIPISPQRAKLELSSLDYGENRYYVMCEDDNAKRNYYGEEYKINYNSAALLIVSKGFENKGNGIIDLKVSTAGGAGGNGESICYYAKFEGDKTDPGVYQNKVGSSSVYSTSFGEPIEGFFNVDGEVTKKHVKEISGLSTGISYKFYIRCKDDVGFVTNEKSITVLLSPEPVSGDLTSTCSSQGGDICSASESCPGDYVTASDSNSCCDETCVTSAECTVDSDCNTGETCSANHVCVSQGSTNECNSNSDCGTGQTCSSSGQCIPTGDSSMTCQELGGDFCDSGYKCGGDTISVFYGSEFIQDICCASSTDCVSYGGNPTQTCSTKGGNICGLGLVCAGQFVDSSDAEIRNDARCCIGQCTFAQNDNTPLQQPLFYKSGTKFFVLTNKMAECDIKKNGNWEKMAPTYENTLHSTSIIPSGAYEVKCTDNVNIVGFTAVYS